MSIVRCLELNGDSLLRRVFIGRSLLQRQSRVNPGGGNHAIKPGNDEIYCIFPYPNDIHISEP